MLGALPDDLEGYVELKTVREENGDGDHDLYGLRQPGKRTGTIGTEKPDGSSFNIFVSNEWRPFVLTVGRWADSALCYLEYRYRT